MATPDFTFLIDWEHPDLRPAPVKGRPHQRRVYYKTTCPACGRARWLRACDAKKANTCGICQRSAAGKIGYAALRKAGKTKRLERLRESLKERPSRPERQVMAWLDEWGVAYARQHIFSAGAYTWLIDFVIGSLAVEVRGYWHKRERADKDKALEAAWPGRVLFLEADSDPLQNKASLFAFLQTGALKQ